MEILTLRVVSVWLVLMILPMFLGLGTLMLHREDLSMLFLKFELGMACLSILGMLGLIIGIAWS